MLVFDRFSVQSRLVFVILLFVSLIGLGGAVGYRIMVAGSDQSKMLMEEHVEPLGLLAQIRLLQADSRAQLLLALQHDPTSPFAGMHDHPLTRHIDGIAGNAEKISTLFKQYQERKIEDAREEVLVKAFEKSRATYYSDGILPAVEALKAGAYLKANEIILKSVNPLFNATADADADAGTALGDHILKAAEGEQAEFLAAQEKLLFGFGGVVGVLATLAIAISWATLRSIVGPLREVVRHFGAIAQGDLQQRIEPMATTRSARSSVR